MQREGQEVRLMMESRSQVLSGALSPKVAFVLRHTAMRTIESYGTPVDGLMAWAGRGFEIWGQAGTF